MSGGIRPKGRKSYAATRSPEATEAFHQDQMAQKTLDTDEKKLCPKCANEMFKTVVTDPIPKEFRGTYYTCPTPMCGHVERVNP